MTNEPSLILCVDDDAIGLEVRRVLLERAGYRVLTASSGPDGLELFATHAVGAVVLDYSMPGMTGGEVAQVMRASRPDIPILMLSAHTSLPDASLAAHVHTMTKGEGAHALLGRVHTLLAAGLPSA